MNIEYLAGFFDGEGSVSVVNSLNNGRHSFQVWVQVSNTDIDILETYQRLFKGQIRKLSKKKAHHKQAWMWRVVSKQAVAFLTAIEPYLTIKKEQAQLAIKFQQDRANKKLGHPLSDEELELRLETQRQMKTLNGRFLN